MDVYTICYTENLKAVEVYTITENLKAMEVHTIFYTKSLKTEEVYRSRDRSLVCSLNRSL